MTVRGQVSFRGTVPIRPPLEPRSSLRRKFYYLESVYMFLHIHCIQHTMSFRLPRNLLFYSVSGRQQYNSNANAKLYNTVIKLSDESSLNDQLSPPDLILDVPAAL